MKTILVFIIIFSVIVIVHEFGHFYFARRSGILVREFSIGMGPKLLQWQGKDGVAYTLRMLPLGGYVRMAGADEGEDLQPGMFVSLVLDEHEVVQTINTSQKLQLTNAIPFEVAQSDLVDALTVSGYVNGDDQNMVTYSVDHDATLIESDGTKIRIAPRDVQFQSAKLSRRMLTNFAGPMNNFILTFILCAVLIVLQGGVGDPSTSKLGSILPDSPAQAAGLKQGDRILSLDGKKVDDWNDLVSVIQAHPKEKLTVTYERKGKKYQTTLTPDAVDSGTQKVGQIGVNMAQKSGIGVAITGAFQLSVDMATQIFKALGSMIVHPDIDKLGGPVAIYQQSSIVASQGLKTILYFMALISINIGIFNLLPIPALDGGKLVLNIVELLRGKPMKPEHEGLITMIGVGLILILFVLVTWNDIQRMFFR
ncbi:RIP metalloprotease RseP [Enterococcus columbae]|uniref:Zinc metalloprotease n=1 Tax=Enterococcus columbae DSM 7374 = ATCC 51263 TaxID=1121865 RepID=S1P5J9_9ENTE|nr:RIP metalloprotease RseP [Enterococcus columbae]EOT42917.1 RIP metalloprotease RseP [Enterococcus columbae DSM 7374 = ATCC 51263]EOW87646.1 RIP metalloprotease RseP [Enterococcus columbae DSM 7374 = ATCC 51263]OJG24695.1 RIP metalloprotease RseP [Enterococcus columbae DSM 7374 = ATCC 51263]